MPIMLTRSPVEVAFFVFGINLLRYLLFAVPAFLLFHRWTPERVLSRRLGGLDGSDVVRTGVRCVAAVVLPAALAWAAAAGTRGLVRGDGEGGPLAAAAALAVGGAVLAGGYLLLVRRLRVREVDEVLAPVLRRLGR